MCSAFYPVASMFITGLLKIDEHGWEALAKWPAAGSKPGREGGSLASLQDVFFKQKSVHGWLSLNRSDDMP